MSKQDKQSKHGKPISDEEIARANTTEGVEMKRLPDGSVEGKVKINVGLKDVVLFYLSMYRGEKALPEETRIKIGETIGYFKKYLTAFSFNPKTGEIKYRIKEGGDKEVMNKHLYEDYVRSAVAMFFKEPEPEKSKLHKQPRGYLKTTAKYVGKSTEDPSLFSLPTPLPDGEGGNSLREVISKNTAILGSYLLQLYQENGGKDLVIDNLSPISEMMGNTNYEIKIYLLYLGGYTYPIVDKSPKGGMTLTIEQMFKVTFNYSQKVADKYPSGAFSLVGNNLTSFIKDEAFESIIIKPSPLFIKALEGKGLGNVLVVSDKFVKLALSLETDIAYKILTYSASNQPSHKIKEANLVKHLGLEKQTISQGKPRIRATILKGLEELKAKDHISSYSYDEESEMFSYTYSATYIKYRQSKRQEKTAQPETKKGAG